MLSPLKKGNNDYSKILALLASRARILENICINIIMRFHLRKCNCLQNQVESHSRQRE